MIYVSGKGKIGIDLLEIGDYVRSSKGFSRVLGFLHLQRDLVADFLQIAYQEGGKVAQIEVSAKHLLFSNGNTIAAQNVRVGNILDGVDGNVLEVTNIHLVKRKGVYAPLTESGDIIVNGALASNYVDLLSSTAISHHTMSHALLAPLRGLCWLNFVWCIGETYTAEGYSERIKVFIVISHILNRCRPFVQYGVTLLVAPIIALITALECIICSGLAIAVAGLFALLWFGAHTKL